jgi:hypothetical protein
MNAEKAKYKTSLENIRGSTCREMILISKCLKNCKSAFSLRGKGGIS